MPHGFDNATSVSQPRSIKSTLAQAETDSSGSALDKHCVSLMASHPPPSSMGPTYAVSPEGTCRGHVCVPAVPYSERDVARNSPGTRHFAMMLSTSCHCSLSDEQISKTNNWFLVNNSSQIQQTGCEVLSCRGRRQSSTAHMSLAAALSLTGSGFRVCL